jgi:hypothetical protein
MSGIAVESYNPVDLPCPSRLLQTWVNEYSTAELELLFEDSGWSIVHCETLGPQRLWKLKRTLDFLGNELVPPTN